MRPLSLHGHRDCHHLAREKSWSLLYLKRLIFLSVPPYHLSDWTSRTVSQGFSHASPLPQGPGLPGSPEATEVKTVVKTQEEAEK